MGGEIDEYVRIVTGVVADAEDSRSMVLVLHCLVWTRKGELVWYIYICL